MPAGRPCKIDDKILLKLETAFAMDCTDTEACLFADINPSTLYEYQKKYPQFTKRKEELKQTPVLKAKTKVVNDIKNDTSTAKWYLERRNKHFKPQQKVEYSGSLNILTEDEIDKELSELEAIESTESKKAISKKGKDKAKNC